MTKMQGSHGRRLGIRTPGHGGLLYILVIGEVALAADLITQLIFKHLKRNFAMTTGSSPQIWCTGKVGGAGRLDHGGHLLLWNAFLAMHFLIYHVTQSLLGLLNSAADATELTP